MKKGDIYRVEEVREKAAAADITLEGDPIPAGGVVEITFLAIMDETTAVKTCRLGYKRAGTYYWMQREPASTGIYGIHFSGSIHLVEGEAPAAMVESATAADTIRFFARGIYQ